MREAMFYEKLEDNKVRCVLCAWNCVIPEGKTGVCRVRKNVGGKLYSLVYDKVSSAVPNPVEKKPLYNFAPGSMTFSICTPGCNWKCQYCLDGNTEIMIREAGRIKVIEAKKLDKYFRRSEKETHPSYLEVLSFKGFRKVNIISRVPSYWVYEIITKHGKRVKLTPEHRVMVWEGGEVKEKRVSDLKVGDKLNVDLPKVKSEYLEELNLLDEIKSVPDKHLKWVYARNVRKIIDKIKKKLGKSYAEICRALNVNYAPCHYRAGVMPVKYFIKLVEKYDVSESELEQVKIGVRGSKYSLPCIFRLKPEFMRLLGYFVAEGNFSNNNLVLSNKNGTILDDMMSLVGNGLKRHVMISGIPGKTPQIFFAGKMHSIFLKYVLEVGSGARNKTIPDLIFNVSPRLSKEFLTGYLSGDGTLAKKEKKEKDYWIRFSTTSRKLKNRLSYLLGINGINFTIQSMRYERTLPCGKKEETRDWRINIYKYKAIMALLNKSSFVDSRQTVLEKKVGLGKEHITQKRKLEKVVKIKREKTSHKYSYDLTLEGGGSWQEHTFFAGDGILVHNCCNWILSQGGIEGRELAPKEIVRLAKDSGCRGLSYTFTEPTIFYELSYDTAKIAKKEGLYNTWVTNGYTNPEPIRKISKYLDAVTVDFKGSGDKKFLRNFSSVPSPEPIYRALKGYKKCGVHIEVTDLIVPKTGDSMEKVKELVEWILENLGPETPIHFLRFFPNYLVHNLPSTPIKTLEEAYDIARGLGMDYVYLGNVYDGRNNTYCPECGKLLTERIGMSAVECKIRDGRCPFCGAKINVIGWKWSPFSEE